MFCIEWQESMTSRKPLDQMFFDWHVVKQWRELRVSWWGCWQNRRMFQLQVVKEKWCRWERSELEVVNGKSKRFCLSLSHPIKHQLKYHASYYNNEFPNFCRKWRSNKKNTGRETKVSITCNHRYCICESLLLWVFVSHLMSNALYMSRERKKSLGDQTRLPDAIKVSLPREVMTSRESRNAW